jgi:hypothetical protein
LGTLTHDQIARTEHEPRSLLFLALHGHPVELVIGYQNADISVLNVNEREL